MLDTVRRYVEAGREVLTPKKAEELAHALVEQGQVRADQAGRLARDLIAWSRRSSERFRATIRHEVQEVISRSGVASKAEVESLKRRIRELESKAKAKPKSPARKTTQRSAGSRSTTAGRSKSTTTRARPRGSAGRTKPPGSPGA